MSYIENTNVRVCIFFSFDDSTWSENIRYSIGFNTHDTETGIFMDD